MTKNEALETTLAEAEASLGNAIAEAAKTDADQADANANIEKARTYCRQAHAALIRNRRTEPIA